MNITSLIVESENGIACIVTMRWKKICTRFLVRSPADLSTWTVRLDARNDIVRHSRPASDGKLRGGWCCRLCRDVVVAAETADTKPVFTATIQNDCAIVLRSLWKPILSQFIGTFRQFSTTRNGESRFLKSTDASSATDLYVLHDSVIRSVITIDRVIYRMFTIKHSVYLGVVRSRLSVWVLVCVSFCQYNNNNNNNTSICKAHNVSIRAESEAPKTRKVRHVSEEISFRSIAWKNDIPSASVYIEHDLRLYCGECDLVGDLMFSQVRSVRHS